MDARPALGSDREGRGGIVSERGADDTDLTTMASLAAASDHFWLSVTALAATMDGDPSASEQALDQLESDLRQLNKDKRDAMRRHMTTIVAQLARLEVRMVEADGPVGRI